VHGAQAVSHPGQEIITLVARDLQQGKGEAECRAEQAVQSAVELGTELGVAQVQTRLVAIARSRLTQRRVLTAGGSAHLVRHHAPPL
jgi:hypothetical protein